MIYVTEDFSKVVAEFGTGEMLVSTMVPPEDRPGVAVMFSQMTKAMKIGHIKDDVEVKIEDKPSIILHFTAIESMDLIISRLKELRDRMQNDLSA